MRKKFLGLVCAVAVVAACGGGGGSSSGEQAAENSLDAFVALFTYFETNFATACTEGVTSTSCNCPGSGTVTIPSSWINAAATSAALQSVAKDVAVASNCTDASGNDFNGTLESDDGVTATATFSPFGQCTSVAGTINTSACSGSITAVCDGESFTCTVVDAGDECDLNC